MKKHHNYHDPCQLEKNNLQSGTFKTRAQHTHTHHNSPKYNGKQHGLRHEHSRTQNTTNAQTFVEHDLNLQLHNGTEGSITPGHSETHLRGQKKLRGQFDKSKTQSICADLNINGSTPIAAETTTHNSGITINRHNQEITSNIRIDTMKGAQISKHHDRQINQRPTSKGITNLSWERRM